MVVWRNGSWTPYDSKALRPLLLKEGENAQEQVGELNLTLRGWANYFNLGPVSKAYRAVDAHVRGRLRRWLRSKHKIDSSGWSRYPDRYLYKTLGLVELSLLTQRLPWAKA